MNKITFDNVINAIDIDVTIAFDSNANYRQSKRLEYNGHSGEYTVTIDRGGVRELHKFSSPDDAIDKYNDFDVHQETK